MTGYNETEIKRCDFKVALSKKPPVKKPPHPKKKTLAPAGNAGFSKFVKIRNLMDDLRFDWLATYR